MRQKELYCVLASFFIYYLIYIYVPVVGPTFYFDAVGVQDIAKGIFPALGDYFNTHTNCLPTPGYTDGIFYQLVEDAKEAGERPTAAFPSSHVGVSTICMILAWHSGNRKLLYVMLPFYIFLCYGYRIYSGALSHPCHRWPHLCRRHLFCIDGSIERE